MDITEGTRVPIKVAMSNGITKRVRRIYAPEFRAETVNLIRDGGRAVKDVSTSLGINERLVRKWLRKADGSVANGTAETLTSAEKEELTHLRREVKVLRMEREILKRAATFFAKENA